eukprot:SAG31_NODE_39853_length_285_cov_0.795699_1_plen_66_part_01
MATLETRLAQCPTANGLETLPIAPQSAKANGRSSQRTTRSMQEKRARSINCLELFQTQQDLRKLAV